MITRTFATTKAKFLAFNKGTKELETQELTLPGKFEQGEKLVKTVSKSLVDTVYTLVEITDLVLHEELYGMLDETFLAHATVQPPRPVKTTEKVEG